MYSLKLELDRYVKMVDCDSFFDHAMDSVLNPKNKLDYHLAIYMIGASQIYSHVEQDQLLNPFGKNNVFNIEISFDWKVPLYPLEYNFIRSVNKNYHNHIIHTKNLGLKLYEDNVVCIDGIYLGIDRFREIKFRLSGKVIYEKFYSPRNYMIQSIVNDIAERYLENLPGGLQGYIDALGEADNEESRTGIYSEALLEDKDLSEYMPTGKKVSAEDIDDLINDIDDLIAESDDRDE